MKRLLILLSLTFIVGTSHAQREGIDTFEGIPIESNVDDFVRKAAEKGYAIARKDDAQPPVSKTYLTGTYLGYDAEIFFETDGDDNIMVISIEYAGSDDRLKQIYKSIRKHLKKTHSTVLDYDDASCTVVGRIMLRLKDDRVVLSCGDFSKALAVAIVQKSVGNDGEDDICPPTIDDGGERFGTFKGVRIGGTAEEFARKLAEKGYEIHNDLEDDFFDKTYLTGTFFNEPANIYLSTRESNTEMVAVAYNRPDSEFKESIRLYCALRDALREKYGDTDYSFGNDLLDCKESDPDKMAELLLGNDEARFSYSIHSKQNPDYTYISLQITGGSHLFTYLIFYNPAGLHDAPQGSDSDAATSAYDDIYPPTIDDGGERFGTFKGVRIGGTAERLAQKLAEKGYEIHYDPKAKYVNKTYLTGTFFNEPVTLKLNAQDMQNTVTVANPRKDMNARESIELYLAFREALRQKYDTADWIIDDSKDCKDPDPAKMEKQLQRNDKQRFVYYVLRKDSPNDTYITLSIDGGSYFATRLMFFNSYSGARQVRD